MVLTPSRSLPLALLAALALVGCRVSADFEDATPPTIAQWKKRSAPVRRRLRVPSQ